MKLMNFSIKSSVGFWDIKYTRGNMYAKYNRKW